jgi:hypothetical protein
MPIVMGPKSNPSGRRLVRQSRQNPSSPLVAESPPQHRNNTLRRGNLLQKKSLDGAVKYLRWSWDYIQQITRVDTLGLDGRELSVNVRHSLAKALVRRNAGEELDLERARELVDGLALVRLPFGGGGEVDGRIRQKSIGCTF